MFVLIKYIGMISTAPPINITIRDAMRNCTGFLSSQRWRDSPAMRFVDKGANAGAMASVSFEKRPDLAVLMIFHTPMIAPEI